MNLSPPPGVCGLESNNIFSCKRSNNQYLVVCAPHFHSVKSALLLYTVLNSLTRIPLPLPHLPLSCCQWWGVPEQVVDKVLRSWVHRPQVDPTGAALSQEPRTAGVDGMNGAGSSTTTMNGVVPLARLMLRGNSITDAGVLALVPLVEASVTLEEVDLRGNAIGTQGQLALHNVGAWAARTGDRRPLARKIKVEGLRETNVDRDREKKRMNHSSEVSQFHACLLVMSYSIPTPCTTGGRLLCTAGFRWPHAPLFVQYKSIGHTNLSASNVHKTRVRNRVIIFSISWQLSSCPPKYGRR